MYYYYPYVPYVTPYQPHPYIPSHTYDRSYPHHHVNHMARQQTVRGEATWTEGGPVTKCNIPWSANQYMTAAVGTGAPYRCGESLKIKNLTTGREIIVTVVDEVSGYPQNRINIHRRAFIALGANPDVGVINIEITPSPELEEEKWGRYLLEMTQAAYPNYNVTDYQSVEETQVSENRTRERYEFILQNQQEQITVRGTVVYNPNTDRVISIDLQEV